MRPEAQQILQFIDEHVLTDLASDELQEIINNLPIDIEEAASKFCEHFGLGDWFYEALIASNVDISAELINIGLRKQKEEHEALNDQVEIDHDLRLAQGAIV